MIQRRGKGQWKTVQSVSDAKRLIESHILIPPNYIFSLRKTFSLEDQAKLIYDMTCELSKFNYDKIIYRKMILNMIHILHKASSNKLINAILDSLMFDRNADVTVKVILEVILAQDLVRQDEELFATAIAFVVDLGVGFKRLDPQHLNKKIGKSISLISQALNYVSKSSDIRIRLSLLYYFCHIEAEEKNKPILKKILSRFGFSVLDQLFNWFFVKKTEQVSLVFFIEILPSILSLEGSFQEIINDIFKKFMLKDPSRFALFGSFFIDYLAEAHKEDVALQQTFLRHLGILYKIASDINQKILGISLLEIIKKDAGPFKNELLQHLATSSSIRKNFRRMALDMRDGNKILKLEIKPMFGKRKRGRKPSLSHLHHIGPCSQVVLVQQVPYFKAS